jgi:cellulose synthase/poly-beta-1,6-N-acetylglucosamine synthase-like glycosyltransferase
MMQTIAEENFITNQSSEGDGHPPEISIFLPVFNEEPNLRPLHEKLNQSLAQLGRTAEIIYVDDGSSDGSLNVCAKSPPETDAYASLPCAAITARRRPWPPGFTPPKDAS